jgi:pSer/pThr/pTyr-binding forkhead associated (FHA) protein
MSDKGEPKKPESELNSAHKSQQPQGKKAKKRAPAGGKQQAGASALAQEAERLQVAALQKQPVDLTERLKSEDLSGIPELSDLPFGTGRDAARHYRKLPLSLTGAPIPENTPRWRIELDGLGPGVEPMGLDILGDAVIGRGRVGNQPADLDLDQYGGLEQGVSRRHALLRPTANHLYVIDLGSTNGSMHNGLPLGPGIARSLKHNDTVTLGRMSFTVKVIDGPASHKVVPPLFPEGESEPTKDLTGLTGGAAAPYVAPTKTKMESITPEMIEARRKELEEKASGDAPPEKPPK